MPGPIAIGRKESVILSAERFEPFAADTEAAPTSSALPKRFTSNQVPMKSIFSLAMSVLDLPKACLYIDVPQKWRIVTSRLTWHGDVPLWMRPAR
jgi:hypothetical protein